MEGIYIDAVKKVSSTILDRHEGVKKVKELVRVPWEYLHRTSMNASCELEPNAGTSDTRLAHEPLHFFAAVLCAIAGVCTPSSITLTDVMVHWLIYGRMMSNRRLLSSVTH